MVKAPLNAIKLPHVECHYRAATATWSKPKLVSDFLPPFRSFASSASPEKQCFVELNGKARANLKQSALTQSAFRDQYGKMRIFRPSAYASQLSDLANQSSMPSVPGELFLEAIRLAASHNSRNLPACDNSSTLRIQPFLTETTGYAPSTSDDQYTLYVLVAPVDSEAGNESLDVLVEESFDRTAPTGRNSLEVESGYGSVFANDPMAREDGFGATIQIDSSTGAECVQSSYATLIGVQRKGDLTNVIISSTNSVAGIITIDSFVQVASHLGWRVEKRPIKYNELAKFDEVIAVGEAMSINSVRRIFRPSNNDEVVYLTSSNNENSAARVKSMISGIQNGRGDDPFGWMIDAENSHSSSPYLAEAKMWWGRL